MIRILFTILITILAASFTMAQSDYHKAEFSAGYSIDREQDDVDGITLHGFDSSVTGNVSKYVGLKFNVSGHYKRFSESGVNADLSLYNFLGGIQVKNNSKDRTVKPFAHALAGVASGKVRVSCPPATPCSFSDRETGFAMAVGGGLDVKVSKHVDIRVVQADYNPNRLGGNWNNNYRISFGIVLH